MQCPNDEKFAQYDEGKLSEDERFEFLQHLRECSDCSTLFAMTYGYICGSINICPDEERLSSLAEGKLSDGEREAILKHIAVCEKCSAELYILRKSLSAKPAARKKPASKRNVYQLIAIAAVITLVIGFAGSNVLNRHLLTQAPDVELEAPKSIYEAIEVRAAAPAPEKTEEPVLRSMVSRTDAMRKSVEQSYLGDGNASPMAPNATISIPGHTDSSISEKELTEYQIANVITNYELAPPVFEVIYNGYDGDESEIIRLLQSITGIDEERAKSTIESRATIIKEYASMEEAQRIKEELESAGAKIEINIK